MKVLNALQCTLGEGPLWHPTRSCLFWFDILSKTMHCQTGTDVQSWSFDRYHSAAGWLDHDHLLIASEDGLWRFHIETAERSLVVALEAENPVTRSNDGRADPWGGFWIGTMGKALEPQAGAIYRYHEGALRKIVGDITISNAICFAPDRSCAYYTDTPTRQIMRLPLDGGTGWPTGPATCIVDLTDAGLNPDGAVTDAAGNLWVALWGASRVACYAPDGRHLRDEALPAEQPTCPAFGGAHLRDLIVTSAADGKDGTYDGQTFMLGDAAQGVAEPQVIL